jgi:hypothetical protein
MVSDVRSSNPAPSARLLRSHTTAALLARWHTRKLVERHGAFNAFQVGSGANDAAMRYLHDLEVCNSVHRPVLGELWSSFRIL